MCRFECDNMPSKNITLNVDEDLYNKYREFCKKKEKGLIIYIGNSR